MKIKKFASNENLAGLIFILPAFIGIVIFIIIPVICSFGLSFTNWDLLNDIKYAGLDNYKNIFTESVFLKIILNTFVFAISTTIFGVIIPLILAYILQGKIKGAEFFKVSYFLPFITPMIVIGVVWQWIFDPNIGFLNSILNSHLKWLYDSSLALPSLIAVSVWKLIGYNMVIFLSGFSSIPTSVIEAAKIDGAGGINLFSKVIVPMLSPTIFFVTVITVINSMQVFDLIYLMTQGGPDNSTNVIVYAIYKNAFEFFDVGKSCALAYVLFVIILALTLLQWHYRKKLVYIEK